MYNGGEKEGDFYGRKGCDSRGKNDDHQMCIRDSISGGPMYYILHGMGEKWRPLAMFFAVAGVLVALFGIGTMTQVNSITGSLQASFGTAPEAVSYTHLI